MTRRKIARTVLVEGKVYERRPDGSLIPFAYRSGYKRLDSRTAAAVATMAAHDRATMPNNESAKGEIARPTKLPVGIRLDDDVLAWFKASGPGYQTRINTVLRRHVEAQRKAR
jgi:uncharacterized protein (DUF4415 family)